MNCPRCSAELLDSATFCTQCGTTIRQTGFSYLPAGTPPWPGTLPENTSYYAATATMSPPQIVSATPPTSKPKPKRSVGSMLLIFVLLVLSIVIGVGGTIGILAASGQLATPAVTGSRTAQLAPQSAPTAVDSPTPTTTTNTPTTQGNQLPTPSSFQVVKVAEVGVSLKYPADWIEDPVQTDTNSSATNFHPQQNIGIVFVVQRFSNSGSAQIKSPDDLNQVSLQPLIMDPTLHNYKEVQIANAAPTIGGVQWVERDATFANAHNVVLHVVTISVKRNNLYYNLFYFAPDTAFGEAMQKYYSQILGSFLFTS